MNESTDFLAAAIWRRPKQVALDSRTLVFNLNVQTLAYAILPAMLLVSVAEADTLGHSYPRICNINIGNPIYYDQAAVIAQFSKGDIALLGFYRTWEQHRQRKPGAMRNAVRALKAKNPQILVGQYSLLNEAPDATTTHPDNYKGAKISREGWWLSDTNGRQTQWTTVYGKYDVNISDYVKPDADGLRYPEWMAAREFELYFKPVPEFDIWYLDNALSKPAVKSADWDNDRKTMESNSSPIIQKKYREANVREWEAIRAMAPKVLLVGNSDDLSSPEYKGKLNGQVLEALMGLSWSTMTLKGWDAAMARYHNAFRDTAEPHLVVFNIHGGLKDYRQMRFGLASSLMNNGYFAYSEVNASYQSTPWFDEFDINLGYPIDGPQTSPYRDGVYRREFVYGLVFVNPTTSPVTVEVPGGFKRIKGRQAPSINDGKAISGLVTVPAKDGLILLRSGV